MEDDRLEAMVMGAFVADTLALGAHWIYDTQRIARDLGRVDQPRAPGAGSYHPTKGRGDLTHYGDQTLVLLESVAQAGGFDQERFARDWQAFMADYRGYRDHATKDTLANLRSGRPPSEAGSESSDLSGASRLAPVLFRYAGDPAAQIAAARAQAAATHRHPDVVDSAEFFARVVQAVLAGREVPQAVGEVAETYFPRPPFVRWVADGLASRGEETAGAIRRFGQQCDVQAGFPAVVHLVARYPDDCRSALVENVMAGGDSAARGMLVGMLLGARLGPAAIPEDWLAALTARARIEGSLERIRSLRLRR